MPISLNDVIALETLENKLRAILPEQYQDTYEEVLPISMGSAGLKYDDEGKVAWNQIWATFCDLAMAGGPPHRGMLLEPATSEEIEAQSEKYAAVVREICRGITLVTKLPARASEKPGWIEVQCHSPGMAAWLLRAAVMENILARRDGQHLRLPAGPEFRLPKEIKNVITVMAKTVHYWSEHMPEPQQASMNALLAGPADTELLEPCSVIDASENPGRYRELVQTLAAGIQEATGLACFTDRYAGWVGVQCWSDRAAVWIMRALIVENILARRERDVTFLPVSLDQTGSRNRLVQAFAHAYRLCKIRKIS